MRIPKWLGTLLQHRLHVREDGGAALSAGFVTVQQEFRMLPQRRVHVVPTVPTNTERNPTEGFLDRSKALPMRLSRFGEHLPSTNAAFRLGQWCLLHNVLLFQPGPEESRKERATRCALFRIHLHQ